MSQQVFQPFPQFFDRDGSPLDNGFIYVGLANQNPESSPVQVYYDEALTIPAAQPIRTINGYPSRNGSPAKMYVTQDNFSITVRGKNNELVYYVSEQTGLSTLQQNLASSSGASLIGYNQGDAGAVDRTVQSRLRDFVSVKDFGAAGDGVTNDTTAFTAADAIGQPVYVPEGTYLLSSIPAGKYFGPGIINVFSTNYYLDHAIPSRLIDGLNVAVPDPEEDNGIRYLNLIAGQNSGASVTATTTRANTIFGYDCLSTATDPVRATGFGKQVFKNTTAIYASDAFGTDAIGQGAYVNRSLGVGSNALKWVGSPDPVAVAHDYYRNDPTAPGGDFITAIGLDAPNRWPTIRTDFVGSIAVPNPARIPADWLDAYQNVAVGRNSLLHSLKSEANVAVGVNSMAHALDNQYNTAVGTRSLRDCVSGNDNVAVGNNAALQNISGNDNVAVGFEALKLGSHTSFNVAIGSEAASALTGTDVVPTASPTARRNVFVGPQAGSLATNGAFNVAVGSIALQNTTGGNNTALGAATLVDNTSGTQNVAVGFNALRLNTTAANNTAVGAQALSSNLTGTQSVAVGNSALLNSQVSQNTALGFDALRYTQAGGSHINYSNCTGLGYNTRVSGNNQVQIGDSATTTYVYGTVQNRSDARDKADIRDTVLGLEFIEALRPVDYKWNMRDDYFEKTEDGLVAIENDGSKKRNRFHHGLVAQEVKEACDMLGIDFGGYQDHTKNGGDDVLTIGYDELIAPLINAVKQLSARVRDLESRQ